MSAHIYRTWNVYRCYDADDWLLYVGCSSNVHERMYQHSMAFTGWPMAVARVEVSADLPKPEAVRLEAQTIHDLAPIFNVAHNSLVERSEHPTVPPSRICQQRGHWNAPIGSGVAA